MRLRISLGLVVIGVLVSSLPLWAADFVIVGPRAQGMGGAFVAVANDTTACYWNPAGLAQIKGKGPWSKGPSPKFGVSMPVGLRVLGHYGSIDTIDEIRKYTPTDPLVDAAALEGWLREFDKPGRGISGDAHAGLLFNYKNFGISVLELCPLAVIPDVDLDPAHLGVNIDLNDTSITLKGMELREYGLSYAHHLGLKSLLGGVTIKYIDAYTYSNYVPVWDKVAGVDWDEWLDETTKKNKRHSKDIGVDAGLLWAPAKWVRFGAVGKYLNTPEFKYYDARTGDEEKLKIDPQARAGMAFLPTKNLTIALDGDITKNKSLVPDYDKQNVAFGIEWLLLKQILALRLGAYKNIAEADIDAVYTFGLGFRAWAFHFDLAGAMDLENNEAGAGARFSFLF